MSKSVSWYKPPWIHGGTLKNEQQKERIAELENFVVFAARSFARDAAFVQKTTEILAKGKDGEGRTISGSDGRPAPKINRQRFGRSNVKRAP